MDRGASRIFRREALRRNAGRLEGDILRTPSGWTTWSYRILFAALVAIVAFSVLATISEYASGPAVVWVPGKLDLTATVQGTVHSIDIRSGEHVAAGELLIRLQSWQAEAELSRAQREFDLQLMKTLRDPSDAQARQTLTALRTQKDLAKARLEQLFIRAPRTGIVGDVRIRPGQAVAAGDVVLHLLDPSREPSILAIVPAQYRPQLRPGMSMRFELKGYRFAYTEATITSVGNQIIGPLEVKRHLGQELGDTVEIKGPVVLIESVPSSPTFEIEGQRFDFHHGMSGVGEVRVRSERVIVALIPGLRVLLRRTHG
ncbi:HlyD family efflux transporter periplasmic adaptor subunit [Polyangium sp. 15x6]|uniref:efflux RND transporter periplasmic adaptor subunit n=1 Tax=Polyangium sp. 15x6 TaxID=3042687 RepID=UPI00249B7504|nr:HlyD family efflux transporter periplasmic adaptor subunit [Polyangium sp. 15x6]MDI3285863.1 HlyD family efflux transporter periplasmic adaptor subunit [Polyangium sp. 15x6]